MSTSDSVHEEFPRLELESFPIIPQDPPLGLGNQSVQNIPPERTTNRDDTHCGLSSLTTCALFDGFSNGTLVTPNLTPADRGEKGEWSFLA